MSEDVTMTAAKTARKNLHALDDLRVELRERECTFLRSRGWQYTSHTPGFIWMWQRTLHGVSILLSQQGALECERAILAGDAPTTIGVNHAGR